MLFTFIAVPTVRGNQTGKKVFILNSFNREYIWTDNVVKGIDQIFANSDLNIETSSAYMDLKRVPYSQEYIDQLKAYYKVRFKDADFDAILASDNDAFEFLLKYRDELFPGVPVVFSAINDFDPTMLRDHTAFTGYPENTDYISTIKLALKLRPKAKTVLVVSDNTTTGRAHFSAVRKIEPSFDGRVTLDFLSVGDYTFAEVRDRLRSLNDDTVVLLLHHFMDNTGATQSVQTGTPFLTSHCPVPCFVVADIRVGLGAVGGKVVSGYHYGQASARMIVDILNGTDIGSIPVGEGPNQNIFDYRVMKRFGIAERDLPEESIIINHPTSILDQYRQEVIYIAISFLLLIALLIFMFLEIQRRRTLTKKLIKNISEIKQLEEELRKSETKFKTLFEQAGDYILILTPQASGPPLIVDANLTAIEKHGFTRDELIGKPISILDDIETQGQNFEREKRLLSGEHLIIETTHKRKDGSIFPVEASVTLLKNGDANPLYISIERDITERKKAEEQLKVQKEILNKSQEIAHLGSWHFDIRMNLLTWSDEQYRIFGKIPSEFGATYEAFLDTIHPDDKEMVDKAYTHAIKNNLPYECVHRIVREDGEVRVVHEKSEDIIDENGTVIHSFGFTQDITERSRIEQERKELETKLFQVYKMEAIGTLAGGIAHDFNNMLTIILGNSELAIHDIPPGNPARESVSEVITTSRRAAALIRQILAFSRKEKMELIPIRLQSFIKETLKLLRSTTPATVSIIQDISQDCGAILADPTQLHQLIMNLFNNAIHAMDEKGEIKISVQETNVNRDQENDFSIMTRMLPKASGVYVKLSVTDVGHGIEREMLERIFDPFFTTKEVGKGTGMGLAVVHGIVESHGGFITVRSEMGKGSTFNVFFPVTDKEGSLKVEGSEKLQVGTERILLVDDEESLLTMAKRMLESLGYEVLCMDSGLKALEIFKSDPDLFDLIITDQSMPNISGTELVAEILKVKPDLPIILCSGYSSKVSEENAREKGVTKFINKPYDRNTLAEAVREVLDDTV